MDTGFLIQENDFQSFTWQHGMPLLIIGVFGILLILYGRRLENYKKKHHVLFIISLIPALTILIQSMIPMLDGSFSMKDDLPFHICRFVAIAAPFAIWKMNTFWMGIFYFWILAGTLNANITPDVEFGFPHYNYFAYWLSHSFLVILPLYYVIVFKIRIEYIDLRNAFWMGNVFLLFTLAVNVFIGSNYMYSRHKPPVSSLLDYLGPWPTYLITGQLLALVLFFILYLPFLMKKIPRSGRWSN